MIEYVLLAIVKVFDNIINTAKSISTYKEQKVVSSVLTIISQLIFYLVISQVIEDNTLLSIIIVSASSGVGNYIAFTLNSKFKKAAKWVFVLTSSDADDVQRLCNYLAKNKIKYIANNGLTRKNEPTIHIIAFSKSKNDSRLIEEFLENTEARYLKEII